jgi:hypothetical protein
LFGHSPLDVFDFMSQFGYSPYRVDESATLQSVSSAMQPLPDHNFIFLHPTHPIMK